MSRFGILLLACLAFAVGACDKPQPQPTLVDTAVVEAPKEKPRAVSPEGVAYLQKLRTGRTPFGTNGFDLAALRTGMGTRRAPANKEIKLARVKAGEVPC